MTYLYCNDCDWSQDDFYSETGYNPANSLKNWMELLCSDKVDKQFTTDAEFIHKNGNITAREVIARNFEKYAKNIRTMKYITIDHWEKNKDTAVCPNCGSRHLNID